MRRRKVFFAPEALDDLITIYEWLASRAGGSFADNYASRIEAYCRSFDIASERGQGRDDIRPGLRISNFEGRITIAFAVGKDRVDILRLFYAGRDWETDMR